MSVSSKQREVVVLCVNGRRVTIKTSISTSIGQVIEEACAKQKLDPYDYNLKHLKKILDPSSSLQYLNIPNHAQLELIEAQERRIEGVVTVNLVTDTGQRLIADFPSNTPLIEILHHHERKDENNFHIPSASLEEEPFVVYTMRKILGEELETVSLKSLGLYGGRCMMRYGVQKISSRADQNPIVISKPTSCVKIPQPYPSASTSAKDDHVVLAEERSTHPESEGLVSTSTSPSIINDKRNAPPEVTGRDDNTLSLSNDRDSSVGNEPSRNSAMAVEQMDCSSSMRDNRSLCHTTDDSNTFLQGHSLRLDTKPTSSFEVKLEERSESSGGSSIKQKVAPNKQCKIIPLSSEHNSLLFNLDDAPPAISESETDEFFELTVNEIRKLYGEKVRDLRELEEAPLMTQEMRLLEKDSRLLNAMNRHPVTQLRICFPDRHVIQANFKPRNTIREVMDFLRPLLIRRDVEFSLCTPFPRKVLDPILSLVDAECIPKARLYFSSEGGPSFLNQETLSKKSSFEGASNAIVLSKASSSVYIGPDDSTPPQSVARTTDPSSAQDYKPPRPNTISQTQHKPKWFKLGK